MSSDQPKTPKCFMCGVIAQPMKEVKRVNRSAYRCLDDAACTSRSAKQLSLAKLGRLF